MFAVYLQFRGSHLTTLHFQTVKVFSLELPSDCQLEDDDSVAIEIHLDGTCVERTSVSFEYTH
jgi:hypothetical protein